MKINLNWCVKKVAKQKQQEIIVKKNCDWIKYNKKINPRREGSKNVQMLSTVSEEKFQSIAKSNFRKDWNQNELSSGDLHFYFLFIRLVVGKISTGSASKKNSAMMRVLVRLIFYYQPHVGLNFW